MLFVNNIKYICIYSLYIISFHGNLLVKWVNKKIYIKSTRSFIVVRNQLNLTLYTTILKTKPENEAN